MDQMSTIMVKTRTQRAKVPFLALKVHLGPTSGFWCLNDKMIKELMTFAKCEIGKMSYKLY
jgi:hypothetical protein